MMQRSATNGAADMKAPRAIATEQKLLPAVSSEKRNNDFLKDDQENLKVIEGVIAKFSGSPQPEIPYSSTLSR